MRVVRGILEYAVIAYIGIASVVFVPYFNWQAAREMGFVSWLFAGELVPTMKAAVWPYFLLRHDPRASPSKPQPPFNAVEMARYSKVLSKATEEPLGSADLDELRSVIQDYVKRTGNAPRTDEMKVAASAMAIAAEYQSELGKCLLYSWDNRQLFITARLETLREAMKGGRSEQTLKNDLTQLHAAAGRDGYWTDDEGNSYSLTREDIVAGLAKLEVQNSNWERIQQVLKQAVR